MYNQNVCIESHNRGANLFQSSVIRKHMCKETLKALLKTNPKWRAIGKIDYRRCRSLNCSTTTYWKDYRAGIHHTDIPHEQCIINIVTGSSVVIVRVASSGIARATAARMICSRLIAVIAVSHIEPVRIASSGPSHSLDLVSIGLLTNCMHRPTYTTYCKLSQICAEPHVHRKNAGGAGGCRGGAGNKGGAGVLME